MTANVFCLCNQKGGVGKTTTAVNLAASLGAHGRRVLVIDFDPQGNATSGLGVDRNEVQTTSYDLLVFGTKPSQLIKQSCIEHVDMIPSNSSLAASEVELIEREKREFLLREAIEELREVYDFILIDCPPSLGLLTVNALVASDVMLIPLQCEYYALEGLGQLLQTYELVRGKLNPFLELGAVILTMADFRTNLTGQVIEDVRSHFGERVFKTVVPRSVKVSEAPSFGKPVVIYDPQSRGAKAYEEVGREFLERFGARASSRGPVKSAADVKS